MACWEVLLKICVVGHSLVHVRQVTYFRRLAEEQRQHVLLLAPAHWGLLSCFDQKHESADWSFTVRGLDIAPLKEVGGDGGLPDTTAISQYNFAMIGAGPVLEAWKPDVVLVQQEPESVLAHQMMGWATEHGVRFAVFTWENLHPRGVRSQAVLRECDLVVCGNDDAERLVKPFNDKTIILPQVGCAEDHFQGRSVPRTVDVAFVGRKAPEKGIEYLMAAWPTAKVLEWLPWERLPWYYSSAKVVCCPSVDTDFWREQAAPYVALEANLCGAAVVAFEAGSIPFWHRCPGFAPLANPGILLTPQKDVQALKEGIEAALSDWERMGRQGGEWVRRWISTPVIAKRLVEALSGS